MIRDELPAILPSLDRYARSLTRFDHDDLVNDTVVRALECEHQFRPQGDHALKRWLFTIMRNLFLNAVRVRRVTTLDPGHDIFVSREALDAREARDDLIDVARKWPRLSPLHQEILTVAMRDGADYGQGDEIAATLGIAFGTAKSRLCRAREALRRA